MLIKKQGDKYWLVQESWRDWFGIIVSSDLLAESKEVLVPAGFIKTNEIKEANSSVFWVWYIYPFIQLLAAIITVWWIVPKWLNRHGYFYTNEKKIGWFWLSRIRFRKIKK